MGNSLALLLAIMFCYPRFSMWISPDKWLNPISWHDGKYDPRNHRCANIYIYIYIIIILKRACRKTFESSKKQIYLVWYHWINLIKYDRVAPKSIVCTRVLPPTNMHKTQNINNIKHKIKTTMKRVYWFNI